MLVNDIRKDEFMKTFYKLKEIEFADSSMLKTLYDYKTNDEYE